VADFQALQRKADVITSREPSWASRHGSYRPASGRGVQEFDDLRRQQTEREREQAKRDWDGHLRRDLLQRDKDRKAASVVPTLYTGRVLTVEVRIYRFEAAFRGGDHARNRLAFAGPEDRLEPLLRPNGFTSDEPEFLDFVRLLADLTSARNTMAEKVYNVVMSLSSPPLRFVLRREGDARAWATDPPVPIHEVRFGNADEFLSHEFLPTSVVATAEGWEFAPTESLSKDLVEYFASVGKVPDDCMDRAVIETWKTSWDSWQAAHPRSRQYSAPLTYNLVKIRTENDVVGGRKSLVQLEKFLADTNLSVVVMDVWRNVVWKHVHEGPRPNVSPDTLYVVATCGHLYRVPKSENYSASHDLVKDVKTKATAKEPKTTYTIPPDLDPSLSSWYFCESMEELLAAIGRAKDLPEPEKVKDSKKKPAKQSIQIHCTENLYDVFLMLRAKKRMKPEMGYYGGDLSSLSLNLNRANVSIRQFKVEGEEFKSIFDGDLNHAKRFIDAFSKARKSIIHRHLKSHYSQNLRHAFETYRRGPLKLCYSDVRRAGLGVDIRSAYPSVLLGVKDLPVFSASDEFRVWEKEPLEDSAIYLVERMREDLSDSDRLCLDKRFNLVSGFVLRGFFPEAPPDPERDKPVHALEALIDEHDYLCKAGERILKGKSVHRPWKFRDMKAVFYSNDQVMDRLVELVDEIARARGLVMPEEAKKYEIRAWIRPVHLVPNPFTDVAAKMIASVGSGKVSKFGLNSLIGLTGRRSAQTLEAQFTTDYNEAYTHVESQSDILNFADGYIYFIKSDQVLMTDGFYPIQFLVLDLMRLSLRDLHKAIVDSGRKVLGLNTDCFVVEASSEFESFVFNEWLPLFKMFGEGQRLGGDVEALEAEMKAMLARPEMKSAMSMPKGFPLTTDRSLQSMGKYHLEEWPKIVYPNVRLIREQPAPETLTFPTTGLLSDVALCLKAVAEPAEFNRYPVAIRPKFEYVVLNETFDWFGEATRAVRTGTLVLGAVAGAGKTSCCRRNATGHLLCVVPTHKRIHEFLRDFEKSVASWSADGPVKDRYFGKDVKSLECVTMAKFVGRSFYDDENKESISLDRFDTILVDELFQSDMPDIISCVRVLEGVRDAGRDCLILANGDTFQLTNHKSWNNMGENQAYADQFLWRVFPSRVFLETNWRLKTDKDKAKLMSMLAKMKAGAKPFELLREHGLADQFFSDVAFVGKDRAEPMQCLTLSNQLGNELNRRFAGPEREGMWVVGKSDAAAFKKAGLLRNKTYRVTEVVGDCYRLDHETAAEDEDEDEDAGLYPSIWFRRSVAWTAHSVQGETIVEDYGIFEANEHFADWRWFYTAFSRAEYLNKVWIYNGPSLFDFKFLAAKIQEKLRGCIASDKEQGFPVTCDLDADWFGQKFKDQNFRCAECSCMLSFNWTETDEDSRMTQFSPNRLDNSKGHVKRNTNIVCLRCQNGTAHD
jgi:hypothetical protein